MVSPRAKKRPAAKKKRAPRGNGAAEKSAAGSATYVYAIVGRAKTTPKTNGAPRGLPGSKSLRLLEAGDGLYIVAADVPLPEYAASTIESKLQDLKWVSACAIGHESVVEHFTKKGTVVPLKLFTLFSNDERALADLARQKKSLLRTVGRIEGGEEWGLRVIFDETRAVRRAKQEIAQST